MIATIGWGSLSLSSFCRTLNSFAINLSSVVVLQRGPHRLSRPRVTRGHTGWPNRILLNMISCVSERIIWEVHFTLSEEEGRISKRCTRKAISDSGGEAPSPSCSLQQLSSFTKGVLVNKMS